MGVVSSNIQMAFFDKVQSVRLNENILEKARFLLEKHPKKYSGLNHIFRCGVLKLYENEVEKDGLLREKEGINPKNSRNAAGKRSNTTDHI